MRNTPNTRTGFAAKRHCKVIKAKPESFLLATDGPSAARAATTSSSIGWRAGEGERFGKRPRFPKLKSRYLTGKMPVPLIRRPSPALAPLVPRGAREKSASPHFCRKCATLRHGIYGCQVLAENERFTRGVCDMRGLRIQNEPPCGGGQEGSTLGVLMRRPWPVRTVSALRAAWGL